MVCLIVGCKFLKIRGEIVDKPFFSDEQRQLQDEFDGRQVADALFDKRVNTELSVEQIKFLESSLFFFIASGCGERIDCSIKCGDAGFVKVLAPNRLVWPDYDGNLMFRTLGNIAVNSNVAMLFVNFENPSEVNSPGQVGKLRINGRATVQRGSGEFGFEGAKNIVCVEIDFVIPNCPRYLPDMQLLRSSKYTPKPGVTPPTPEWKTRDYIRPILPSSKQ